MPVLSFVIGAFLIFFVLLLCTECGLLDNRLVVIDWKTSGKYKKQEWIHDYFIQGTAYALAAFESRLVSQLPEEVHIYIFSPQRCQIFTAPVATFGPLWIQRLNQYQYLTQSLTA